MVDITLYFTQPISDNVVALRVYEASNANGPWTQIERTLEVGGYPDYVTEHTTPYALSENDWFAVAWEDATGNVGDMSAGMQGSSDTTSILASPQDVNAHLGTTTVKATPGNTAAIQISVARMVKGFLSRILDKSVYNTWVSPATTPDIIREVAAQLIASQLYFNETSNSTVEIPDTHYAQKLYNQAMTLLNQVIQGTVIIPDITDTPVEGLSSLDFFPVDSTDRAFTMGMNL